MILGVAVDLPEIVQLRVRQNILSAKHRRHHGVILVVVLVHAVPTDQVQVGKAGLQLDRDGLDVTSVIVIVNRIRFLLPNDTAIEHVPFFGQSDLHQFACGQLDQLFVFRIPDAVVLETEIFQAVAGLVRIRHHLG